ncbi:hypothetical protein [Alicyclobacillus sp. ALC3]|nr:hypothetical protein [Alicyclobacillus sp. ALC3]
MDTYFVIAVTVAALTGMNVWFKVLTKRLERRIAMESPTQSH